MKRKIAYALAALLLLAAPVWAQTLLEVQVATAISLKLDQNVRLPKGSYRALGPGVKRWLGKLRNAKDYGNWEAYVAKGLAKRMRPVYVQQVSAAFAQAGYLLESNRKFRVGNEVHQQYVFENMTGRRAMLYVIEAPDALVWLVGWSN